MRQARAHVRVASRLPYPRTTVRWRLTLLYAGTFLVCGAALLAVTYTLVSHQITGGWGINLPARAQGSVAGNAPALSGGSGAARSGGGGGGGTVTPSATEQPAAARLKSDAIPFPARSLKMPPNVPSAVLRIFDSSAGRELLRLVQDQQQVQELHQLEIESAIALGIMAIFSGLLGWVVAGRALRPLRTITATARQISEADLHRRLDLPGPRDELRTLADTIDGLLARLEAAFESQRRFVANASHELRTPLATMRAALDVAIAKPRVSSQVTALDTSLREDLDQADRLLESFLVLARAQRGALGEETSVSLPWVIGGALARRSEVIAAKQIELDSNLAPASVEGSETLLARMVDNLIDNAVRHNPTRGLISITCKADPEAARLVVENSGAILDQGAVEELVEPFRRLRAERTGSQNGHGVGLSIVAAVAAAHGGALRLYAREQGGLGAEITLPVVHHPQAANASA